MLKRYFLALILLVFTISSCIPSHIVEAASPIKVYISGKEIKFTNNPILSNGRTLVEFRPIFQALGMAVDWDASTKAISGKKEKLSIQLTLNRKDAIVNGKIQRLDVPAKAVNGRTLVPLRFVGEASGVKVTWNVTTNSIYIGTEPGIVTMVNGNMKLLGIGFGDKLASVHSNLGQPYKKIEDDYNGIGYGYLYKLKDGEVYVRVQDDRVNYVNYLTSCQCVNPKLDPSITSAFKGTAYHYTNYGDSKEYVVLFQGYTAVTFGAKDDNNKDGKNEHEYKLMGFYPGDLKLHDKKNIRTMKQIVDYYKLY